MDDDVRPVPAEELAGKDELDEDDEMDLRADDLVDDGGAAVAVSFPFRFTPAFRAAAAIFGVTPERTGVTLGGTMLDVRYGPWRVTTDLTNVTGTEPTGPYSWLKTIGPAHLSLTDRGLTFASNPERGLCIRFHRPVRGIEPTGRLLHPALTVTVADPGGLAAVIERARPT